MRKIVSWMLLTLLLVGTLGLALNVRLVRAQLETVYINSDGSITPSNAPISSVDNVTYTFTGNIGYPTYSGIVLERNNTVIDGNGYNLQGEESGNGLSLTDTSNVTIENIIIFDFQEGIYLNSSSNNMISGNTVTTNSQHGIYLDSSSNNTVSGNNVTKDGIGIFVVDSSNNDTVSGNNASANIEAGIYLYNSSGIVVNGNSARASPAGISLISCTNNTVSGNSATANTMLGIEVDNSSKDTISANNVTANVEGIYLQDSSSNVVSGNNATENSQYGIYIVYCSDNTVSGNNITANTDYGIQLTSSNSSVIDCNNVTANGYGIFISSSSNNIFSGDNVTANSLVGFYIWQSTEDTVSLNNVTANGEGFYLGYSSNSTVSGNNVMANIDVGIDLLSSSNNVIFHNNFINNTSQALISNSTNTWDNGYPSGGNYWSNYNGTDFFSGPYQNVTGSDGIGDVPYVIDANNTDHYPLMGEFSDFTVAAGVDVQVVSNSTVSDFQFNGTAILFSVSGASGTTGFCSVRVPTSLLNGTLTVFVNGTQVQYDLLLGSNSSISYLYFTYGHSTEQVTILPEFPESLIIAMLLAMLSAVAVHNKKHSHS